MHVFFPGFIKVLNQFVKSFKKLLVSLLPQTWQLMSSNWIKWSVWSSTSHLLSPALIKGKAAALSFNKIHLYSFFPDLSTTEALFYNLKGRKCHTIKSNFGVAHNRYIEPATFCLWGGSCSGRLTKQTNITRWTLRGYWRIYSTDFLTCCAYDGYIRPF